MTKFTIAICVALFAFVLVSVSQGAPASDGAAGIITRSGGVNGMGVSALAESGLGQGQKALFGNNPTGGAIVMSQQSDVLRSINNNNLMSQRDRDYGGRDYERRDYGSRGYGSRRYGGRGRRYRGRDYDDDDDDDDDGPFSRIFGGFGGFGRRGRRGGRRYRGRSRGGRNCDDDSNIPFISQFVEVICELTDNFFGDSYY